MSFYKKIIVFNAIALILFIVLGGWMIFKFNKFVHTKASDNQEKVYMEINKGESVYSIIKKLQKEKIVSRADWFYYYVRLSGASKKIKAGVHLFFRDYTPKNVLKELESSSVYSTKVTIAEGWTINRIAKALTDRGFNGDKFLSLARSASLAKELTGLNIDTLEGFLYPDTYYFKINEKPEEIIHVMFDRFKSVFYEVTKRYNFTDDDYKKIIIASIVEKETSQNNDRPLVASVIYNRLKRGMPLQMDSTVIYGIRNFSGNLVKDDLRNKNNIFNTYIYRGLPKTPICSPSKESIFAAYHPKNSDYIYFVSKDGRNTIFSKTLKEHNRWVRKYQIH